jgi:integrase
VEGGFPGFSSNFRPAATYVLPFFRANSRDMDGQKLTKRIVDALELKATDYVVWCSKLPGFGCRVWPTGKKTFIVIYRAGGAKSPARKVTIGVLGKFTAEQARDEAIRILAQAELGEDEAAKRASFRAEMTVAELCDEYMREGVDHKKPSTIASDYSRIESHIKPLLGKKRISEVTSADVSKFLRDIANGKARRDQRTAKKRGRSIVRGGKGTATRTVRFLGGIFTYAVKRGYLKENPKKGVELYPDKKGERFLSAEEFQRLGEALRLAETDGIPWTLVEGRKAKHRPVKEKNRREVFNPHVVAAFRLLLFTGCRLGEILTLKWDYVDFQRGMLNLPESKTGKKVGPSCIPGLTNLVRPAASWSLCHCWPATKFTTRRPTTAMAEVDSPCRIEGTSPTRPEAQLCKCWCRKRHGSFDRRQAARPCRPIDDCEICAPRQ